MFKVNNTQNGVKAFLGGFKAEDVNVKVQECKDGNCSCNCDPQMMEKIENIEVSSEENGASITITGDVKAEELEPMMKECLL
ncbi:hypothetical protein [Sulfurimonas marina]|uniref:Uncharacterized protein n=1 Tax=Sulfurimonas marina TaxID=2590551 RepID=A0A7M1AVC4_9BACT|nr:hypothetical protein [Sulfurimonas marina]QOP41375.1 hypothetical protein FJR03_06305 [Sulfurimonas marina]